MTNWAGDGILKGDVPYRISSCLAVLGFRWRWLLHLRQEAAVHERMGRRDAYGAGVLFCRLRFRDVVGLRRDWDRCLSGHQKWVLKFCGLN